MSLTNPSNQIASHERKLWLCPCACRFASRGRRYKCLCLTRRRATWDGSVCAGKVPGQTFDWELAQTDWLCLRHHSAANGGRLFFIRPFTRVTSVTRRCDSVFFFFFLLRKSNFQPQLFKNQLLCEIKCEYFLCFCRKPACFWNLRHTCTEGFQRAGECWEGVVNIFCKC